MNGERNFRARNPRITTALVLLVDVIAAGVIMAASIAVRYYLEHKPSPDNIILVASFIFSASVAGIWIFMGLHRAIWRFTALPDLQKLFSGMVIASAITPLMLFLFYNRGVGFPRSIPLIAGGTFFLYLIISRGIATALSSGRFQSVFRKTDRSKPPAILIGQTESLYEYLGTQRHTQGGTPFQILGLVDPDGGHKGRTIHGVPVLGSVDALPGIIRAFKIANDATPTLVSVDQDRDKTRAYRLVKMASELGAPLAKLRPELGQSLSEFDAADLIGRRIQTPDRAPVLNFLRGKSVLITGAGGTIGSELTRQLSACEPASITLVDASELNIYEIDQDLTTRFAELEQAPNWRAYLGDVRDHERMNDIFKTVKPQIILHAAALKHVPLMESNPIEALRTNIGGTSNIISLAKAHDAESVTLISTDKAVSPNNIMGASKRIAEMLVMAEADAATELRVSAVRFGNVLGSNGSVIPLFEKQIRRGGPVTVTDENVTRFFMTVSEAAALVLQAAAQNAREVQHRAAVYVLDMGEPVKIVKLARQLIRLRGLVPDRDIQIVYTGLRPGEKLRERLVGMEENLEPTPVEGVSRFTGDIGNSKTVLRNVRALMKAAETRDKAAIRKALKLLLPEFEPNGGLS